MTHLANARRAAGLSLRRLAQLTGIHYSLISRFECGRRTPSVDQLQALARHLKVKRWWKLVA